MNIDIDLHVNADLSVTVRQFTAFSEYKGYMNTQHNIEFADLEAALIGMKLLVTETLEKANER